MEQGTEYREDDTRTFPRAIHAIIARAPPTREIGAFSLVRKRATACVLDLVEELQPRRQDLDVFAMCGCHDSRHPVGHAGRVMQEVGLTARQRSGRVRRETGKPGASDWGRVVAMGTKVSPYTGKRYGCVNSTLEKPYSCDHCLGYPTRDIGAFSPGRKRPVACVAQHPSTRWQLRTRNLKAHAPRTSNETEVTLEIGCTCGRKPSNE